MTQAIERMGKHSFIFHDVTEEMARLAERMQEAEEVERIQDPVLRSVTRRVNAFKRGERKVV